MRINTTNPRIYPAPQSTPSHSRRTSFSEDVQVASFDNTLPPHISIEGARIKHKILKQPIPIQHQPVRKRQIPFPKPEKPSNRKTIGNILTGVGLLITFGCVFSNPVGMMVGLFLGMAILFTGLVMATKNDFKVQKTTSVYAKDEHAMHEAIASAEVNQMQVLDLRHLNLFYLPQDIIDLPYLHYILVNKDSAKLLPRKIDGIEIIGK